jgi:Fur family ferric uptake transcriptional regulator
MTTRNTLQKEAIRETFIAVERPLSAEEVMQEAQSRQPGISIATVYRNLKTLLSDGWLQAVEVPGETTRYEVAGKDHHHHFHCQECRKLYELEGCAVPVKAKLPRGFRITGHEFFLFGLCSGCSGRSPEARA